MNQKDVLEEIPFKGYGKISIYDIVSILEPEAIGVDSKSSIYNSVAKKIIGLRISKHVETAGINGQAKLYHRLK